MFPALTFHDELLTIAEQSGKSIQHLMIDATDYSDGAKGLGLNVDSFKKSMNGERPLSSLQIAALAHAGGTDPWLLTHYRMAVMRELLDARTAGADIAREVLAMIERPIDPFTNEETSRRIRVLAEEAARRRGMPPPPPR